MSNFTSYMMTWWFDTFCVISFEHLWIHLSPFWYSAEAKLHMLFKMFSAIKDFEWLVVVRQHHKMADEISWYPIALRVFKDRRPWRHFRQICRDSFFPVGTHVGQTLRHVSLIWQCLSIISAMSVGGDHMDQGGGNIEYSPESHLKLNSMSHHLVCI